MPLPSVDEILHPTRTVTADTSRLSTDPMGEPDIEASVREQVVLFRAPEGSNFVPDKQRNKILLWADPHFEQYTADYQSAIVGLMLDLIQQDIKIYECKKGIWRLVRKKDTDELTTADRTHDLSDQQFFELTADSNAFSILDYVTLRILLQHKQKQNRGIYLRTVHALYIPDAIDISQFKNPHDAAPLAAHPLIRGLTYSVLQSAIPSELQHLPVIDYYLNSTTLSYPQYPSIESLGIVDCTYAPQEEGSFFLDEEQIFNPVNLNVHLANFSALRCLTLIGIEVNLSDPENLPVERIEHFWCKNIKFKNTETLLALLTQMGGLRTLNFELTDISDFGNQLPKRIIWPYLENLRLCNLGADQQYYQFLIRCLYVKKAILERSITSIHYDRPSISKSFELPSLLQWEQLESLTVRDRIFKINVLFELLVHMPHLRELDINLCFSNQPFDCGQIFKVCQQFIWQDVTKLRLRCTDIENAEALLEILKRFPNVKELSLAQVIKSKSDDQNAFDCQKDFFQRLSLEKIESFYYTEFLGIRATDKELNFILNLITHCMPNLKYLLLDNLNETQRDQIELELYSSHPNLQLDLKLEMNFSHTYSPDEPDETAATHGNNASSFHMSPNTVASKKKFLVKNELLPLTTTTPPLSVSLRRERIIPRGCIDLSGEEVEIKYPDVSTTAVEIFPPLYNTLSDFQNAIQEDIHTLGEDFGYYEGIIAVDSERQPFSTRDTQDQLLGILKPPCLCSFYRDPITEQFYIKSSQPFTLRYVIASPRVLLSEEILSRDTINRLSYYRDFHSGTPKTTPKTAAEKINAIRADQVGSCAHRSIACATDTTIIQELQLNFNEVHALLEFIVRDGENTKRTLVDLGGFPAELNLPTPPYNRLPMMDAKPETEVESKEKMTPLKTLAKNWFDEIESNGQIKQHWTFTQSDDTHAAGIYLLCQYRDQAIPAFYVNHPDQLRLLINTLKLINDHQGESVEKPSGPLADFLRMPGNRRLIINWDAFEPIQVAKALVLLDSDFKNASHETLAIAEGLHVVSLQNIKRDTPYISEDFTTRHGVNTPCHLNEEALQVTSRKKALPAAMAISSFRIDLYASDQWESELFGRWRLRPKGFTFEPSDFFKALRNNQSCRLDIMNPPINNVKFDRLLHFLKQGLEFSYAGLSFKDVLVNTRVVSTPRTLWESRVKNLTPVLAFAEDTQIWVLNNTTIESFFSCYTVDKNNNLFTLPGLLEQYQQKTLHLLISHDLPLTAWAKLLDQANKHQVKLNIKLAKGVTWPTLISQFIQLPGTAGAVTAEHSSHHQVIFSKHLLEGCYLPDTLQQHITGCRHDEVFYHLKVEKIDLKSGKFSGAHIDDHSPALEALTTGKTVILTGTLAQAQQEFLAPLLLAKDSYLFYNNQRHKITGKLMLVTDTPLSFYPASIIESYAQVDTHPLLAKSQTYPIPFVPSANELKNSAQVSRQFFEDRLLDINNDPKKRRLITIVGATGTGKTTTCLKLKKREEYFFWGDQDVEAFLQCQAQTGAEDSLLVLDEASLKNPALIEKLSDLLQNPPCTWFNRKRYEIKGRIICLTNPRDYGNKRDIPTVLNYSHIVEFKPIPLEVLYQDSVKPILDKLDLDESVKLDIARDWLKLYAHCLAYNPSSTPISPRELETIALALAAIYTQRKQNIDPRILALKIAQDIMGTAIPLDYLQQCVVFKEQHVWSEELFARPAKVILSNQEEFLFLPEHQPLWTLINYLHAATQFNQRHQLRLTPINHINLMGPPNSGKSVAMQACAAALQLPMTHLPASALLDVQLPMLEEAVKQGKTVIHDESNLNLLEEALNAFQAGIGLDGKPFARCDQSSFLYLSTGNPNLAGRREFKLAEQRRMLQVHMPALSETSVQLLQESLSSEQQSGTRIAKLLRFFKETATQSDPSDPHKPSQPNPQAILIKTHI